ncbi:MAG: FtsB family cell division protein [Ilumatobacteraceae bacterium]
MIDGHKTTAIQRPRASARVLLTREPDESRFGEFTRPIAKEKQLVKGRGKRLLFALIAVVIAAALIASLFVLPVKSWLQQRHDLAKKQNELAVLGDANAKLAADVNRLQTPDGIKEAARQEVGYVGIGERRISVLATPDAPLTLPTGWPYDAIAQIIAVRAAPPPTVAPLPADTQPPAAVPVPTVTAVASPAVTPASSP